MNKKHNNEQKAPAPENTEVKTEEIKELHNEEDLKFKQQAEDYLNQLQRVQAEFDNYRKREEKNKLGIKDFVIQNLMKDFIPFVDNFERALIAADNSNVSLDSLKDGVKLVFQQLDGFLTRLGIKRIESLGKKFDPTMHDAVSKIASEEFEEDHISQILQNGWIMNETVLRPAMVVVSAGKDITRSKQNEQQQ